MNRLVQIVLNMTWSDAGFAPAIEAAGHRAPGAVTFWQITPGSTGAQNPQDTVDEASMIPKKVDRFSVFEAEAAVGAAPIACS
jgi:hypothetical protein